MGSWVRENTFVCLDDITRRREDLNVVIYNPRIITDITERKNLLFNVISERCGVKLTDEELNSLSRYEVCETYNSYCGNSNDESNMLTEFIKKLRKIVNDRKWLEWDRGLRPPIKFQFFYRVEYGSILYVVYTIIIVYTWLMIWYILSSYKICIYYYNMHYIVFSI